ncbi:MAG: acetyl/propionyl/methylcrotonyl-CoA carboxylase subunit alpha [Pseudomonadota bacterium]
MFSKILVANRGEIAVRVIKTARRLGIATVAVYSEADSGALHVQLADEAVHIGSAPSKESYLVGERILEAAVSTGAQAIHPGYGFLSENAEFASACAEKSIVFIGPPAQAIAAMGSKSAAKRIMEAAEVPLVPGYHGDAQDSATLRNAAETMGYPVLLKATAGGGGKGMRQVWSSDEFDQALAAAKRESLASFGDDNMLVEKYLTKPRHVELQVFCDNHGHGVYLAERDCSVQRRHQKVIEEAPAPGMTPALRQQMGETAVKAARAIDYRGAGTVEFLLDEDGSFYFMEMNTRLQVEHPVTEMITGQDLVKWQLAVAAGEPLPLLQDDIEIRGHAFEARVYAEDPANDFLPATGTLDFLRPPAEEEHVRVDTGVREGDEISVYYDPMIAKLIVWGENREQALHRLAMALRQYRIAGTVTNLEFLYNLVSCAPFKQAELDTGFIERHRSLIFTERPGDPEREIAIAALATLLFQKQTQRGSHTDPFSPWQSTEAWRLNQPHVLSLSLDYGGSTHTLSVEQRGERYVVKSSDCETVLRGKLEGEKLTFEVAGHRQHATLAATGDGFTLYLETGALAYRQTPPNLGEVDSAAAAGDLVAPMNGTIVALLVEPKSAVDADTPLLVMEAMKMEHTIKAPTRGSVREFYYQPGDLVDGGAELLDFAGEHSGETSS